MSNLSAFMRANVQQIENHKYVASPRIRGEDGKPVEWEICCISADEYARIRSSCIRQVPVPGKKNQFATQVDTYTFQTKVCARCTVFPDLNDAALQNDWGVVKPEELLGKLLIGGEFDDYVTEVFQHNGFKTARRAGRRGKKLILDGDPEANYAHFCLQKWGWEPSKFLDLPVLERAVVIASINVRCEAERKKEAELKQKARRGRGKRR